MTLALFPDADAAIARLKTVLLPPVIGNKAAANLPTDYLQEKLEAIESDLAHDLRVFLQKTKVFAGDPTEAELSALGDMPYYVEAPYDYVASEWVGESWGLLQLHNKPVASIDSVALRYPYPASTIFQIPDSWVRCDRRAGQVQFIPSSAAPLMVPLNTALLAASAHNNLPQAIWIRYTAGINVADYAELPDLARRMAVLKVLEDRMRSGTTSMSVDGLSQSSTIDFQLMRDGVSAQIEKLRNRIHGLRAFVF